MSDQDQPKVRKLPPPEAERGRVETGAVQFGDDYPGYFIRGDDCAALVMFWDVIAKALRDSQTVPGMAKYYAMQISDMIEDIDQTVFIGGPLGAEKRVEK